MDVRYYFAVEKFNYEKFIRTNGQEINVDDND